MKIGSKAIQRFQNQIRIRDRTHCSFLNEKNNNSKYFSSSSSSHHNQRNYYTNTLNVFFQNKVDGSITQNRSLIYLAAIGGLSLSLAYNYGFDNRISTTALEASANTIKSEEKEKQEDEETTTIINWSGTHSIEVPNKYYFEPETTSELEFIISKCHKLNIPIRPVGSALSPNAISFNPNGMISMANLDRIIQIDTENKTVTAEAGARVSQVIDALRPYGLTLPNLASIAEQQMGGFVQIGAHGTGAAIPPVDDFVTKLKLITPNQGVVELSNDDGEMFHLAKVGLGCLGVVSEITMQCIPAHNLLEHTYVLTRAQAKKNLNKLLKKHKHIRYMWIPYQDAVVVVTNDPEDANSVKIVEKSKQKQLEQNRDNSKPLKDLLKHLSKDSKQSFTDEILNEKGFGELRDALLSFNPLCGKHVDLVNQAEAEFWKQSEGYQLKPSDQLLQFDCGGQVRIKHE